MAQKLDRLSAVNIILSNIGQAAVTRLDNDNPIVTTADNILNEVSNTLQGEGWSFNSEQDYPFTPDQNGFIYVPPNVLALDTPYLSEIDVVQRDGKLYNKRTHSNIFTEQLKLNVVWLIEFDDMPDPFKQYVTMRAANIFAGRVTGSSDQVRFGQQEELSSRAAMLEYETQQGDFNVLSDSQGRNHRTYRPSFAALRY